MGEKIDNGLKKIENPLYFTSIIAGLMLLIAGIILICNKKNEKKKILGYILLTLGILSSIMGVMQLSGML